jgi:SAM-dependent methyltransferase
MFSVFNAVFREIKLSIKTPSRLLKILSLAELKDFFHRRKLYSKYRSEWGEHKTGNSLSKRKYDNYEQYIEHQKSKVSLNETQSMLKEYDVKFRQELKKRLEKAGVIKPGMVVLCLAARIGTEVKAFLDHGCMAVGIDLEPGKGNKHVLFGDFHDIQFPDRSFDAVFTNSLDHVLDIDNVIEEVKRVLKPGGFFIVEAVKGNKEGVAAGFFESFFWDTVGELKGYMGKRFTFLSKNEFEYPWSGEHLIFINK